MVRCAKKNSFQIFFLLFAIEMTVLNVFLQKKSLGPLGVNPTWTMRTKSVQQKTSTKIAETKNAPTHRGIFGLTTISCTGV